MSISLLRLHHHDFSAICFSLKCLSQVQFLTEGRKLLTGTEEAATAWIATDLSHALPFMLGDGSLANRTSDTHQLGASQVSLHSIIYLTRIY